jgi:hypothetical protein
MKIESTLEVLFNSANSRVAVAKADFKYHPLVLRAQIAGIESITVDMAKLVQVQLVTDSENKAFDIFIEKFCELFGRKRD